LDNPGWKVTIDLNETHLEETDFEEVGSEISDDDWYICRVEHSQFQGAGDPKKLEVILQTFIDWAKSDQGWLQPPVYETTEDENGRFWESLLQLPTVEGEECSLENCERNRIKNSVFCREHHFEKYKER
jgi:hypothetical protein